MRNILLLSMLAAGWLQAFSDNCIGFTYNPQADANYTWGTGRSETYDVAIKLDDAMLAGTRVVAARVQVPADAAGIDDCSMWIASDLRLDGKLNAPDLATAPATIADGWMQADFGEGAIVPEGGLYVGYTFTAGHDAASKPVYISAGANEGGFYVHTTSSYRQWRSLSESLGVSSGLQVTVEGDFMANAATLAPVVETNAKADEPGSATVMIANYGANGISSISYQYTADGDTYAYDLALEQPVENIYGRTARIGIEIPALPEGEYAADLAITKVNGEANELGPQPQPLSLCYYKWLPRHLPLFEEYTGTWCSWCPRGYAGMQLMGQLYPDDFVCISYHGDDVMEMLSPDGQGKAYPQMASGFPDAVIDRELQTDPYFGFLPEGSAFGIDIPWKEQAAKFAPAALTLAGEWADDHTVELTATVEFVKAPQQECRIEYVLLANDLHGTRQQGFYQSNSYSGMEEYAELPGLDFFVGQPSPVEGLHFYEVAALTTGLTGVAGSLPADIEPYTAYTHAMRLDADKALNTKGAPIIQDKQSVSAVAFVLSLDGSRYGKVLNAAKVDLDYSGGIADPSQHREPVAVAYYSIAGYQLAEPAAGTLCIRRAIYPDGTSTATLVRY